MQPCWFKSIRKRISFDAQQKVKKVTITMNNREKLDENLLFPVTFLHTVLNGLHLNFTYWLIKRRPHITKADLKLTMWPQAT